MVCRATTAGGTNSPGGDAPTTTPSLPTTQLGLGLKIGLGAAVDIHAKGALVPLRSRCNDASAAAAVAAVAAAEGAAAGAGRGVEGRAELRTEGGDGRVTITFP